MESFYELMIHKHDVKNERFHTALAKLYLKFLYKNRNIEYFKKLNAFLREPTAKYDTC